MPKTKILGTKYSIEYKNTENYHPWETEEFINFLNDVNELTTKKYGWNLDAHSFINNNMLQIYFAPAIGSDSQNRKF